MKTKKLNPKAAKEYLERLAGEYEDANAHTLSATIRELAEHVDRILPREFWRVLVPHDGDLYRDPVLLDIDPDAPDVREITLYVHRDKDSNWDTWLEKLGQEENDAGRDFAYACLEVALDCEVNMQTGDVSIHGVNGVKLATPVNA